MQNNQNETKATVTQFRTVLLSQLSLSSAVVDHATHSSNSEGSDPTNGTERDKIGTKTLCQTNMTQATKMMFMKHIEQNLYGQTKTLKFFKILVAMQINLIGPKVSTTLFRRVLFSQLSLSSAVVDHATHSSNKEG